MEEVGGKCKAGLRCWAGPSQVGLADLSEEANGALIGQPVPLLASAPGWQA
jgi:hypothetical protein